MQVSKLFKWHGNKSNNGDSPSQERTEEESQNLQVSKLFKWRANKSNNGGSPSQEQAEEGSQNLQFGKLFKWHGNKSNNGGSSGQEQAEEGSQISTQLMRDFIERMISDAQQMAEEIKNQARMEAKKEAQEIIQNAMRASGDSTAVMEKAETSENIPSEMTEEHPVPESSGISAVAEVQEQEQKLQDKPESSATVEPKTAVDSSAPDIQPEAAETEQMIESTVDETKTEEPAETPAGKESVTEATTAIEENSIDTVSDTPPVIKQKQSTEVEREVLPMDSTAIFNGDVELAVTVPVDPVAVSRLYNKLQSTPDMKILYTSGSWDKGTVITVSLEKPLPLLGIISNISGVDVKRVGGDNNRGEKASSLLNSNKSPAGRINLALKAI